MKRTQFFRRFSPTPSRKSKDNLLKVKFSNVYKYNLVLTIIFFLEIYKKKLYASSFEFKFCVPNVSFWCYTIISSSTVYLKKIEKKNND